MAISVNELHKTYKGIKAEGVHALRGVSFTLPDTGLVIILGKSGCGKTTLLNILGGLDKADEGEVTFRGKKFSDFTEKEWDSYRNSYCGVVFQEYNLINELSVKENIALALQLQGVRDIDKQVEDALCAVELGGLGNRKVSTLSGGQKQRVTIARAIVKYPDIILADEPTGALDSETGENIFGLLKKFSESRPVIAVTHDRELAEKYGDRIIELSDGKIIADSAAGFDKEQASSAEFICRRGGLPLKAAVKIGCGNYGAHIVRMILAILIAVISFTFFGTAFNIAVTDISDAYYNSVCDKDIKYTVIYKKHGEIPENTDIGLEGILGADKYYYEKTNVTTADRGALAAKGLGTAALINENKTFMFQRHIAAGTSELNHASQQSGKNFAIHAEGFIHMDGAACAERGFTVDGKLPENSSEIAINDDMFFSFSVGGLIDENLKVRPINSVQDIIGCKITVFDGRPNEIKTITGVVYTNSRGYGKNDVIDMYCNRIFVSEDFSEGFTGMLFSFPESRADLKRAVEFVYGYRVNNDIYEFSNELDDAFLAASDMLKVTGNLCFIISVILFIVAILVLIEFISTNIRDQMKQIGIISAMGAGFKDLCKIYFVSALVLCAAVMIVSLPLTALCLLLANSFVTRGSELAIVLIKFSPLVILPLAAIALLAACVGSIIPVLKTRKKVFSELIRTI